MISRSLSVCASAPSSMRTDSVRSQSCSITAAVPSRTIRTPIIATHTTRAAARCRTKSAEDAADAEIDLALDQARDAAQVRRRHAEPREQQTLRPVREGLAGGAEPARCGRAMDAEDRADPIDTVAVDVVILEQQAIARLDQRDRLDHRGAEL